MTEFMTQVVEVEFGKDRKVAERFGEPFLAYFWGKKEASERVWAETGGKKSAAKPSKPN